MKYKRKPATPIEANQFTKIGEGPVGVRTEEDGREYVMTLHDQKVYLQLGDWVVSEGDGIHYYPIKDHVFKSLYNLCEAQS